MVEIKKILPPPYDGREYEETGFFNILLVGMKNCIDTLENNVTISYEASLVA